MAKKNENHRKLFLVLKKLTKGNFNKLEKYLKSDYFSTSIECVQLFDFLKPLYPTFSKFQKEEAKRHLFSSDSEKDFENELNDLFSTLYKQVLSFFALENFLKDQSYQEDCNINYFYQNHFYNSFERVCSKKKKTLEKQTYRDASFYEQQMKLADLIYFHPETDKFKSHKKSKEVKEAKEIKDEIFELNEAAKNLEISFIFSRLRHSIELLQRARIFETPLPNIPLLEEIIELAKEKKNYENPILEIYVNLVQLATKDSADKKFEKLIKKFSKNIHLINPIKRRELHQFLLNEVNFRSRFGNQKEQTEQLDYQIKLYEIGEKKDCLVVFKRISEIVFTNVIMVFCKAGNFNFAENFVKKYQKFLPPHFKNEIVRFSKSCVFFYRQEYLKVFNLLSEKAKFTELYLEHRARTMLLCSEFELHLLHQLPTKKDLDSFETIKLSVESFNKYHQRKRQIAESKNRRYLNLGNLLNKLIESNEIISKNDRQKSKQDILSDLSSYESVAAESWLVKHINNL